MDSKSFLKNQIFFAQFDMKKTFIHWQKIFFTFFFPFFFLLISFSIVKNELPWQQLWENDSLDFIPEKKIYCEKCFILEFLHKKIIFVISR